ncbi:MAG: hypothetical protein U0640_04755 [Phycisphaerales bacterium]
MKSQPEKNITWALLLAKWAEFAKASVALPDDGDAGRVKKSVPAIIGLQSVACALKEVDSLSAKERAAGLDMAQVLIRQYAADIHAIWKGESLHPGVEELINDAHAALREASNAGTGWVLTQPDFVGEHPAELIAALVEGGFAGDLYLPSPGVRLFKSSPLAFVRESAGPVREDVREAVTEFLGHKVVRTQAQREWLQVYRQFDFGKGGAVRDVVVGENALVPGQPLLVPAILKGEAQAISLPIRGASEQGVLPVVFEVE